MSERRGALSGLRVLDLGIITAGAATSQVFADFGADVVKIESLTYQDPFRNWSQIAGGGATSANGSPPFDAVNRGKRGVAIDLKSDAGRATFLDLVATADIVVENFRRGVLQRLGIGFPVLRTANPRIVLLSLSSQGESGPEAGFVSFGSTLEALGGSMAITGYGVDEPPLWTGNNVNYPDQLVSYVAPGLALAALRARDTTGEAIHVDAAQREAVTSVVGETVVEYSSTGRAPRPLGNRHENFAPQGVYPTAGDDEWIALSVQTDAHWISLIQVLRSAGLEAPVDEPALHFVEARRREHDRLDEALARFTARHHAAALAEQLQAAGIPASAVLSPREVLMHPQLEALGFPVTVPGDPTVQRGFIARLHATPGSVAHRAPRLGQHTAEVLQSILGYDDAKITALHDAGAIFSEQRDTSNPRIPLQPQSVSGSRPMNGEA